MINNRVQSFDNDPQASRSGSASGDDDARRLADLHADLGRQIAARTTSDALVAVTSVAVSTVPGAHHASITRDRGGDHFQTLAPTDAIAAEADRLQYELNSGPCVDSVQSDRRFLVPDLAGDDRWPEYGPLATERFGVASMISMSMVLDDDVRASLNLYSDEVGGFTPRSETVAMVMSTHGSVAIGRVMARERATNLELALVNSRRIGMAIGVLMGARRLTSDQAFALMRIASQNRNLRMALVAEEIIETGTLAVPE